MTKKVKIPDIILHILFLPMTPALGVLLVVLFIFRQCVRLYLYLTLGNNFGGLLCSADKIYVPCADQARKNILSLIYVRSDDKFDFMGDVKNVLRERVEERPNDYPKLLATYHTFMGQDYITKNQVKIDETIRPIPLKKGVPFTEEYLKQFVGSVANLPLPKNNTAMWEQHIPTEPLVGLPSNVKGYVYPVLVRFHHSVADGARLVDLNSKIYAEKADYLQYCDKIKFEEKPSRTVISEVIYVAKFIVYIFYLLLTWFTTTLNVTFLREEDKNALHGPKLSGDKLMAWTAEFDTAHVTIVKEIKNRIPNTRFTDVVFSCVSGALYNFFKTNNLEIPGTISSIIPILFYYPPKDKSKPVNLHNEFSFGVLTLPIIDPLNFLEGLEKVKESLNEVRKDSIKDVIYWISNYFSAPFPSTWIKKCLTTKAYTSAISCIPGSDALKVYGGREALSIICSAPHTDECGITLTIFTYANKFHVGLLVDKAIIAEQKKAQYIVDEIIKNMDVLNELSLKKYQK